MKWISVAESNYPWEREALEFVRVGLPNHEPYRAWSNFEFIAEDGSINEVDLLVFGPMGFFLIEIKSRPGRLTGDAGTWFWEHDGRVVTTDNPLLAANSKAKKLKSLLARRRAFKTEGPPPFIEALVFCSAPDLRFELTGTAAFSVCVRDQPSGTRPGIRRAITERACPGLTHSPRGRHDRPMAKLLDKAMEEAGIRSSIRSRRVIDFDLRKVIGEGPGYQDWAAAHATIPERLRRVRLYHVRSTTSREDRLAIERSALREAQILDSLQHPGILRSFGATEHDLGPALLFEHDPLEIRLDHYLAQNKDSLGIDRRLDLIRRIAEAVRYAHDMKVVHRGLSPQSILVVPSRDKPRIKLFNWQIGFRAAGTHSGADPAITPTSHVDRLIDDAGRVYLAPEAADSGAMLGEQLDVFSLGALAYHIFSGEPPASSILDLNAKLRETRGLQISSVMNGARGRLQDLIAYATHPEVAHRLESAEYFLQLLDEVEEELTAPEDHSIDDPRLAQTGDLLNGGYHVVRRIGQGSCSVVFHVEKDGQDFILKAASDHEQGDLLRREYAILERLRHQYIVDVDELIEIGAHAAFLMRPVFAAREEKKIETLRSRLRSEGRLQAEMLQRFGEDLLEIVRFLEEQGVAHRDIKPDNIAVGAVGRGDVLHAVLFDFSLANVHVDDIRAGTHGYLDPLLPLRKPPRWDLHAERYAAAVTLHELAAGVLPRWDDGQTLPQFLDCEITIEPDLFEPGLREPLAEFFRRAFRRDVSQRFDNAEAMANAWKQCFAKVGGKVDFDERADDQAILARIDAATLDTPIPELGLGTRATNALDRAEIHTVEALLAGTTRKLQRFRGVGTKTRREILEARARLEERLGDALARRRAERGGDLVPEPDRETGDPGVDLLAHGILPQKRERAFEVVLALLGLDDDRLPRRRGAVHWPSQGEVAAAVGLGSARVNQLFLEALDDWKDDPAIASLRDDFVVALEAAGGAMSVPELVEALLAARGCLEDEPKRSRLAAAVVRAAVETERAAETEPTSPPRFQVRRNGDRILIALGPEVAEYAFGLGDVADELAKLEPLASPQQAIQRLRALPAPEVAANLADARLLRLAVAASEHAALSSLLEFYPRNIDPLRALMLARGALLGATPLSIDGLRERVRGRYPDHQRLPDRPELDALLQRAGLELHWSPARQVYEAPSLERIAVSTDSRLSRRLERVEHAEITPEIADARRFEERLRIGLDRGSFYLLLVPGRLHEAARSGLVDRFGLTVVDLEELFLDALRAAALEARVDFDLVVKTDARPGFGGWSKLLILVGRALESVEAAILAHDSPVLLIHVGLLARYDRIDLLERLRDTVGRDGAPPSLWVLTIGGHEAAVDGKVVPVLGAGQRVAVPESWILERRRALPAAGAES